MPKTLLLTVESFSRTDTREYRVTLDRSPRLRGAQDGMLRLFDPDEVIRDIPSLLAPIFEAGDSIEYCNVTYTSIDDVVDGVRQAMVDWR